MRKLAALVIFIALMLVACRSESERSAVARVAPASTAASVAPGTDPAARPARLRRLWSGREFNFYASSPSPDGRYVTEIDWSTGDLAVRDLATGELHRLTDKGSWQESGEYALFSTFSPGGDRVAYTWWNDEGQRHELRVLDFASRRREPPRGSNPRVVHSPSGLSPYGVFGWSPQGEILVSLQRPDRTTALAFISVEDGRARILESFDWRLPHAELSTDGRFVAYDLPGDANAPERDVHLLSTDGGRKVTLVEGPDDDVVLGWEPDGGLLYASRGSEGSTVWRWRIEGGGPSGSPELLHEDLLGRVEPLGFAAGALYYGVVVESPTFGVARLDLDGRRLLSDASPVESPHAGTMSAWDWSPDGRHYAVAVRGDPPGSGFHVVIGSADGSPLRSFHGHGRVERLRWVPERRAVALYGYDEIGRPGIRVLDLASGEIGLIRRFDRTWGAMGGHFAISPDGRSVYFRLLAPGAPVSRPTEGTIVELDLETGAERPIQRVRWGGSLAVSPDGEWLAFVDHDPDSPEPVSLRVIPARGGPPREVFRKGDGTGVEGLNWTPDGRGILFLGGSAGDVDLRVVPAGGGVVETLRNVPSLGYADPRLHPDGRRIAFLSGESRGEIWAMEGSGADATASIGTEASR